MKIKHTFCLCCLLLMVTATSLFAQKNPQRGYIVMKGDTIAGTIDFLSRKKCAETCVFLKDGETEYQNYSPKDISAYSLLDNTVCFESKTYTIDGEAQSLFAECLLKGCVSVFRYEESSSDVVFFLEDGNGKVAVVKEIDYIDQMTPEDANIKKHQVLDPALEMLSESQQTMNRLWNTQLTASNIVAIVRDYNKQYCEGYQEPVAFEYKAKNSSSSKLHFTMEAGMFGTSYDISADYQPTAKAFRLGVGGEWFFPRVDNRLSLQVMASYYQCTASITYPSVIYDPYENVDKEVLATENLEDKTVTLLCGVNYTFLPKDCITPFVCGGITLPFCISDLGLTDVLYKERDAVDKMLPINLCLYLGGGLNLNIRNHRLRLIGRYELPIKKGYTDFIKAGTFVGLSVVI